MLLMIMPLNSNDILRWHSHHTRVYITYDEGPSSILNCKCVRWLWQWVLQTPLTHKRDITYIAFIRTLIVVGVSTELIFKRMLIAS
jgi:hypothetical protein